MAFNNDPRIKGFLFAIIFLIVALSYITKILSNNFIYKYLDNIKSKYIQNFIIGFHWLISITFAIILPEYLMRYIFFKNLIEENPILNHLSILCFLFIALVIIGGILNLMICGVFKNKQIKS